MIGDYVGEYPIDMTPREARAEIDRQMKANAPPQEIVRNNLIRVRLPDRKPVTCEADFIVHADFYQDIALIVWVEHNGLWPTYASQNELLKAISQIPVGQYVMTPNYRIERHKLEL